MNSNDRFNILLKVLGGYSVVLFWSVFVLSAKYQGVGLAAFALLITSCFGLYFNKHIEPFLGCDTINRRESKIIKNEIKLSTFILRACLLWVALNMVFATGVYLYFILESIENGLIKSLIEISIIALAIYLLGKSDS